LFTLETAHGRNLLPVFRRCELDTVTDIGNGIAVRVDLEFV
jgi:hypothetical protein